MNKIKIIFIGLLIGCFVLAALISLKIQNKEDYRQKTVLAQEIRKALDHLMTDLYDARENTIQGVPADGKWYNRIAFEHVRLGALEYVLRGGHLWCLNKDKAVLIADDIGALRIRRQKETPDILEVQIEARNNVALVSNFKVRIRH